MARLLSFAGGNPIELPSGAHRQAAGVRTSPLLQTFARLEAVSRDHASALARIAADILRERENGGDHAA